MTKLYCSAVDCDNLETDDIGRTFCKLDMVCFGYSRTDTEVVWDCMDWKEE